MPIRQRTGLWGLPGLTWYLLFFVLPLLFGVWLSLQRRGAGGAVEAAWTLENFRGLADRQMLSIATRTARLAAVTTLVCLVVGAPVAWHLAFIRSRNLRFALLLAVVIPLWVTSLVRVYAFVSVTRPEGLLARVAGGVGVRGAAHLFYGEFGTLLGMSSAFLPLMIFPLFVMLRRLAATDLLAAAANLGATPWKRLRHVVLPNVRGGLVAGVVMVFVPALGSYVIPAILGGGRNQFVGTEIADRFLIARDYPAAAALAMALAAVAVLMVLPALRQLKEGGDVLG